MTMEHREELISAYLDGEVTPEERAQVEQWLADDPAMRQLHDELRGVRDSMQTLPRHQLDRDLAPLVLRRAEQEVLSGGPRVGHVQMASPGAEISPGWSSRRTWRRMLWPAVAIAAALAIKAFEAPPATKERQVASAPQGGELSAAPAQQRQQPELSAAPEAPALAADVDYDKGDHDSGKNDKSYALKARKQAATENESVVQSAAPAGAAGAMNSPTDALARPAPRSAAAKPAASPAEVVPRAGAALGAGRMLESDAAAEVTPLPEVLCEVSAAFIQQHGLEALLDEQKIAWPAVPEQESRARRKAAPAEKETSRELVLEVSSERLEALVKALRGRTGEVGRVLVPTGLSETLAKKTEEPQTLQVRFSLQPAEYVRPAPQ